MNNILTCTEKHSTIICFERKVTHLNLRHIVSVRSVCYIQFSFIASCTRVVFIIANNVIQEGIKRYDSK
jgi:hypothetical protein